MHRIVVFCDVKNPAARALFRGVLGALAVRSDAGVVAICPFGNSSLAAQIRGWLGVGLVRALQRMMDPALPLHRWGPAPVALGGVARRMGAEIVRSAWTPSGLEGLSRRLMGLGANAAISLYTPRKFPPGLLGMFRSAINYHNGQLPRYRGIRATHWSVYMRERTSGWAVHHMTDRLDEGNILASGRVPIGEGCGIGELDRAKAEGALAALPVWLERWLGGDPGIPQVGEGRLFTRADYRAITRVEFPERLYSGEWLWRIRCFSRVWADVGGAALPVTRLVPVDPLNRGMIGWRCADGVCLRVTRANFLPVAWYKCRTGGGPSSVAGQGHSGRGDDDF